VASTYTKDNAEIQSPPLHFVGASNTAGFGASVSFENRVVDHLKKTLNAAQLQQLPKTTIAIDYFFPTHFFELRTAKPKEIAQQVEQLLTKWRSQSELVLVAELPTREVFKEYLARLRLPAVFDHPIAFIVKALEENEVLHRNTRLVNTKLREMAERDKRIQILDFSVIAEALLAGRWKGKVVPTESEIFVDQLHFNDLGQTFVFNLWLKQPLEAFSDRTTIPEMNYRKLSAEEASTLNFNQSGSKEDFQASKNGRYWFQFANGADSFSLKNAELVIPGSLLNESKDSTLTLENFDQIQFLVNKIADPHSKNDVIQLSGIGLLVLQLREKGFFGYLQNEGGIQTLTLDLAKALSYTKISLRETQPNVFKGLGYDHWFSALFDYKRWIPTMTYRWRNFLGFVPASNYRLTFEKKAPSHPSESSIQLSGLWEIYPMLKDSNSIQNTERIRLGYIPAPWDSILQEQSSQVPHLRYRFDLEIPKSSTAAQNRQP